MDTAASEFWNADMNKYDLDFKSPAGNPDDENRYVSFFFNNVIIKINLYPLLLISQKLIFIIKTARKTGSLAF